VLIPARNEESILPQTLATLMPQIQGETAWWWLRITATTRRRRSPARNRAVVVEREDIARRGKGLRLDHGMRFLEQDPPAIVIMIDGRLHDPSGARSTALVEACGGDGRPAQACYLMDQSIHAGRAIWFHRLHSW